MNLKRLIGAIGLLFITVSAAAAQTQSLEYDFLSTTPTVVATYTQLLKVNSSAFVTITPACAAVTTNTHCTLALPAPGVKSGDVVTVMVTLGNVSAVSAPYTYSPGATPTVPTNIKIVTVITFTVP